MAPWRGSEKWRHRELAWLVLAALVLLFGLTLVLNVMIAWLQVGLLLAIAVVILYMYVSRRVP